MKIVDLDKDRAVEAIVSRLAAARSGDGPVFADGTWGSFAPLLAAQIRARLQRPILYISPHIDDADRICEDLQVFSGSSVQTFPVWESLPSGTIEAADEIGGQRMRLCLEIFKGPSRPWIVSTSVQALNQPIAPPEQLCSGGLELVVGKTIEPQKLAEWLLDRGFERNDIVDCPGQFAVRGGIVDIYAQVSVSVSGDFPAEPAAVRVEFFGDNIESIRLIDLDTQRSDRSVERMTIIAASRDSASRQGRLFLDILPADTIVILEEPAQTAEVSDVFLSRTGDTGGMYSWRSIYDALSRFARLEISRFAPGGAGETVHLDVASVQEFEHTASRIWAEKQNVLAALAERARTDSVILFCDNQAQIARVREILSQTCGGVPDGLRICPGFIHQGFIIRSLSTIVVSHHSLFGQVSILRRIRTPRTVSPVESLLDLHKGDYVVHVLYGIGRFIGIEMMDRHGRSSEYLTIEYADKVRIHVPAASVHLVHKFIGSMPRRPSLSRIGTKKWERQKQQVAAGVAALAAELLDIQARRKQMGGVSFGPDTLWQKEFEESFPYGETPDQTGASAAIKSDMSAATPMDRLLCGDVGYGKTELAMRAAFKAVQAGKQAAVLVPTTVLCVQHGRTFVERFADFPLRVETLNRFTPTKDIRRIIRDTRLGGVDILIGTHRLLSSDVGFRDLGLLIIDEEQRFGVEHKERLKRFRVNVDVLTMTATPIPRTLHMSMLGLRDISSLATPPLDRRSVVTSVCRFDKDLIRRVISFELGRSGQVFFVYNRVRTIHKAAQMVRSILSDQKVVVDVAHGQMHKHELEDAMVRFVSGRTDVLVCSTIIEAGLDIPNANTMIICDADRFGLAQLHQLRGRVGRYRHRAYAYLLLPADRPVSPAAGRRLKAIEEFSQLGAGFRIALRDLEIRGAGNILGPEQSGHINTVGYEMYCRLLSQAVKRLRDEPVEEAPQAVIELGIAAGIPKNYISSDSQRLDVYRRIAQSCCREDLDHISGELSDMFGPVPAAVETLFEISGIRLSADRWRISSIVVHNDDLIFSFKEGAAVSDLFSRCPGRVSVPDARTVYVRLEKRYFEPKTLLAVLKKLLDLSR